jgi:hypothetical protein
MKYTTIASLLLPALALVFYVQSSQDELFTGLAQDKVQANLEKHKREGTDVSSREVLGITSRESAAQYHGDRMLDPFANLPVSDELIAVETEIISIGAFVDPEDVDAKSDSAGAKQIRLGTALPVSDGGLSQSQTSETISIGDPIEFDSVGHRELDTSKAVISIGPQLPVDLAISGAGTQTTQGGSVPIDTGESILVPPES